MIQSKKTIAIVATGGTIAGSGRIGESAQYQAGTLSVVSILETIPQINNLAELQVHPFCSKDSNDITHDDLIQLKNFVEEIERDPNVDGIVITHGTDTLEETAFFLNLTLNVHKPVIMTGAMRPATATSADGPMNLYQSVALAANPNAIDLGVLVVIGDTIYSGRDLTKINSIKTDAFEVAAPGPVGYMQDDQVYLIHSPYRRHTHYSQFAHSTYPFDKKVEIFYVHLNCDPDLLRYMLDHYDGVVLAGTGAGNYPSQIKEVIQNYQGDCTIVRSSRLLEGAAFDSPIFDPLQKTIPAHRLSAHKARILLLLGLSNHCSKEQLRQLYKEY
ncbi:asparaginase [Allobaculum stercoricanis]|uniref:asparaginase n=1 Tax=Allobaculum stercoricanis TaxID=174709 RepID=UPI00037DA952|nr:asparaginase [Allobaculum stercoricanis]